MRKVVFEAYTQVSLIVDVAGDGYIPARTDPYVYYETPLQSRDSPRAVVEVQSLKIGTWRLKWGIIKIVLESLYDLIVKYKADWHFAVDFYIVDKRLGTVGAGGVWPPGIRTLKDA